MMTFNEALEEIGHYEAMVEQLREGIEEALDPELSREELVGKVKGLAELLPHQDDDEDGGGDED